MPYDVGMLYRDGNPLVYDGADFHATLEAALEASGYRSIRDEQATLRGRGVYSGVGISSYVEGPGIGPFEGAVVRLDPSGKVLVSTGACSQGQGHETVYKQLLCDRLGIHPSQVHYIQGDTDKVANGEGTGGSRSAALGDTIAQGSTRFYQVYYRDPNPSFCPDPPGGTFNVSNAIAVIWGA